VLCDEAELTELPLTDDGLLADDALADDTDDSVLCDDSVL
jgi:hypothetical protein